MVQEPWGEAPGAGVPIEFLAGWLGCSDVQLILIDFKVLVAPIDETTFLYMYH